MARLSLFAFFLFAAGCYCTEPAGSRSRSELEAKIAQLIKRNEALQEDLVRLQARHVVLAQKLADLENHTSWARWMDPEPCIVPRIFGSVVGVFTKPSCVFIDVGDDEGVQVGYQFTVFRENAYIGRLLVDRVFPKKKSSCRILFDKTRASPKAGDIVATRMD